MSATDPTAGEPCPAHGERSTYAAPFVGYIPEPNCTCRMIGAAPAEPDAGWGERIGPVNAEVTRPNLTDPTAGEHGCPKHPASSMSGENCVFCRQTPAEPDAGDVEALAKVLGTAFRAKRYGGGPEAEIGLATAVLASGWLAAHDDAVRRKAGDERAERIAQAIEAVADEHEAVMDARLPMPDRPERESGRKTVRRLRSIARESR